MGVYSILSIRRLNEVNKMVIKLRSVNVETDYEQLKKEMSEQTLRKGELTNDQMMRELIDWYRHSKLNK